MGSPTTTVISIAIIIASCTLVLASIRNYYVMRMTSTSKAAKLAQAVLGVESHMHFEIMKFKNKQLEEDMDSLLQTIFKQSKNMQPTTTKKAPAKPKPKKTTLTKEEQELLIKKQMTKYNMLKNQQTIIKGLKGQ